MGLSRGPAWAMLAVTTLLAPLPASADEAEGGDEATEEGPKVGLDVMITERGPRRPWRLRIRNVSDEPVRLVADPRLMRFEVAVPGKKKTVDCDLPKEMVPEAPVEEAVMFLKPGNWVVRRFDPRMFCFSTGDQETLVPGAVVTPTFGWKTTTKTKWKRGRRVEVPLPETPPYVATAVKEDSELLPVKNVPVAPITLGPDYAAWAPPEEEEDKEPLALRIKKGVDARDERGIVLTVILKNQSGHRQRVFFRRELITFEVFGPDGLSECQAEPDARNPPPAAFSSMRAGSTRSLASRLVELCPRGTFGRPGFYLVGARLDAEVDGKEYGLDTFLGTVRTDRPVTVRVRKGEDPFFIGLRRKRGGHRRGGNGAGQKPEEAAPEAPPSEPSAPPSEPAPTPDNGADDSSGSNGPPQEPREPRPPRSAPG